MSDQLEKWANESEENKRICAQEDLIVDTTEDILIIMENKGVSKADLANRLNKSKAYISQVLNGTRNMTLRTLSDICFSLQIKPSTSLKDIETSNWLNSYEPYNQWEVDQCFSNQREEKQVKKTSNVIYADFTQKRQAYGS